MEDLRKILEGVTDSYEDFVNSVLNYVDRGGDKSEEDIINFINNSTNVTTSDILEFIYPDSTPLDIIDDEDDEVIEKDKPYTGEFRENVLEWLNGQDTITCTISQKRIRNKLLKLAEQYPDEVKIEHMNDGVTILVKIPLKYLSIRRPRELSEEERAKAAERLKAFRKNKKD